jgi:hypothetical protein
MTMLIDHSMSIVALSHIFRKGISGREVVAAIELLEITSYPPSVMNFVFGRIQGHLSLC